VTLKLSVITEIMSQTVASVNNIEKKIASNIALKSVSFELRRGEIVGYIGPNGAGKTTSIRILLGLLKPDAGSVKLFDSNPYLDEQKSSQARERVGAMLEYPGHFIYTTARQNLTYHARLRKIDNVNERVDEVLQLVQLFDRRNSYVETFSKGMMQRLAFARAIIHNPELLVLDEPTSGLDPSAQKEVRDIFKNLAAAGKTVFLSSHNLTEVQEI